MACLPWPARSGHALGKDDGFQLHCSAAWEHRDCQEEQALTAMLIMAHLNAASHVDMPKALCSEVAMGVAFMLACEQVHRS